MRLCLCVFSARSLSKPNLKHHLCTPYMATKWLTTHHHPLHLIVSVCVPVRQIMLTWICLHNLPVKFAAISRCSIKLNSPSSQHLVCATCESYCFVERINWNKSLIDWLMVNCLPCLSPGIGTPFACCLLHTQIKCSCNDISSLKCLWWWLSFSWWWWWRTE